MTNKDKINQQIRDYLIGANSSINLNKREWKWILIQINKKRGR